ncbi:unnamed protein product [Clonostachys rosea f. rosea IK726]|uniref:Uncharacterized protein n=1 Tax=Clonostachys rosea f. rosea IK726 TaxID=1349383 RepID=A0ACA9TX17_BIOOC|nr:unnamed protein product [Clonostachys rosea f. rosea IK726]
MDLFRVRLNCIDHYQATPTRYDPQLRNDVRPFNISKQPKVPVIRVFGSTETGQKVCAHIHGAFPYLYIEYDGHLAQDSVGAYIYRLHLAIDQALAVSYRRNQFDNNARYVARITLVKGVPFYGFHVGYKFYLKIYMFNPVVMTRLTDLLQQGAIMKRQFQPYEAHLQYLLQFMTDYNLYGCEFIDASNTKFRAPVPDPVGDFSSSHLWHSQSVPGQHVTNESGLPRVSHCSIEVDICVQDITNRLRVDERQLHHDFVERRHPIPPDQKLVFSMAGLWRDEVKRRKRQMAPSSEPGTSPLPYETLVSMSAESRASQPEPWLQETELREAIHELVGQELDSQCKPLEFDSFVTKPPFEDSVKTALQSVEDLHPEVLLPALGLAPEPKTAAQQEQQLDEQDEQDEFNFPYDSDQDIFQALFEREQAKDKDLSAQNTAAMGEEDAGHVSEELFVPQEPPPSAQPPVTNPDGSFSLADFDDWTPISLPPSQEASQKASQSRKRPLFDSSPISHTKRVKLGSLAESSTFHDEPPPGGQPQLSSSQPWLSSSPTGSQGTRPSLMSRIQGSADQTINFPIVKNVSHSRAKPGLHLPGQPSRGSVPELSQWDVPEPPSPSSEASFDQGLSTPRAAIRLSQDDSSQFEASFDQGLSTPRAAIRLSQDDSSQFEASFDQGLSTPRAAIRLSQDDSSQFDASLDDASLDDASLDDASLDDASEEMSSQDDDAQDDDSQDDDSQDGDLQHDSFEKGSDEVYEELDSDQDLLLDLSLDLSFDQGLSTPRPIISFSEDDLERFCEELDGDDPTTQTLVYAVPPPGPGEPLSSQQEDDVPTVIYQEPFYSKEKDVPTRMREYAGREFRLRGNTLPYLPDFDPTGGVSSTSRGQKSPYPPNSATKEPSTLLSWDFAKLPPSYEEVESWWSQKQEKKQEQPLKNSFESTPTHFLSQIEGPTPDNKHGFKYSPRARSDKVKLEGSYMSTMSLEIHVNTRGKLVPNPEEDEVQCIFWSFKSDDPANSSQDYLQAGQSGVVVLSEDGVLARRMQKLDLGEVHGETSELDVFVRMVEIVRFHDPDVLTGFEVHASSWGFLIERARLMYDFNLCDQFSRMKCDSHGKFGKEGDRWGFNTTSTIRVTGRHMINIWRAMRGELSLLQYTMENIAWHLLHRRVPHYPWEVLTRWYRSHNIAQVIRVLRYYQARTRTDLEILEANELVSRTSEQARVLGVDFFSVFSRGSQFKVESIMFRIAKPENFMLVSPSRKQVGGQNALECLPLVMEPHSAFYSSPVVVLDFQSLYPSVMIAYNYCYSTFLGRVTDWRGMNKMGFTEYRREQGLLGLLEDDINISPNGMMYVKPEIRKSLLAKMLREILETRVMVKSSMKKDKEDKALQRLLNNRQLALKLLANVTYGYTSASFSGRMPCSEIADSIVQTARETLERAVAHIQSIEKWAAHVVYGDTDSIFVYLPGRSKDEAFDIGNEIADAITNMNPRPIKLKFEKVYLPCVLLAKKRYVGYKYESRDQVKPDFDAKGIETVRRDGTPAEQKMEEKALRMLFESADLSRIKSYFREQCRKIIRGHVSIQDFCFAKEVRLGTVAPEDLLANPHWRLDAQYYITKNIIPPLERIFNLVGASVRQWYDEMPKVKHHNSHMFAAQRVGGGRKMTLEAYFQSMHCVVCSRRFKNYRNSTVCRRCMGRKRAPVALHALQTRLSHEEKRYREVMTQCRQCEGGRGVLGDVQCDSKDCPVFWSRVKQVGRLESMRACTEPAMQSLIHGIERRALEW